MEIDLEYEMLILRDILEEGEYLSDGYTLNARPVKENLMGCAYEKYCKYRYEKKYGSLRKRIDSVARCIALSKLGKNNIYVNKIPKLDIILAGILYPLALLGYKKKYSIS